LINTLISIFTARFARDAETAEISIFSLALDPPSRKLWRGREEGDGKVLSPATGGTAKAK
jgi:hypothetical protein